MFVYVPLLLTIVAFVAVTIPALYLRPAVYTHGSKPYSDTGFDITPDWSKETNRVNELYALVFSTLLVIFIAVKPRRAIVFRRMLFSFTLAEIVHIMQMFSTIFPEPNSKMSARHQAFLLFPLIYAVGWLTVQFYANSKLVCVISHALALFGVWLLIPTRYMYTVDIFSALFAGILPFVLFHWYVRTHRSIKKRAFLRWFEQDALVSDFGLDRDKDSPLCRYHLRHFRAPSLGGEEQRSNEEQLMDVVERRSSTQLRWWRVTSFGVAAAIACFGGFGTLAAVNYADTQRPIGLPLCNDVLYPWLPTVPGRAPDFMLTVQLVLVFAFMMCSPRRWTILRRQCFMFGVIMMMRCFTVNATFPPDPSELCAQREHPVGTTCGDLIFSGHSVSFMLSAFVVRYYVRIPWIEKLCWIWTVMGWFIIVSSRLHYTRDVVTSLLVGFSTIHMCHVSMFWRPDRKRKYLLLQWFEVDDVLWKICCSAKRK